MGPALLIWICFLYTDLFDMDLGLVYGFDRHSRIDWRLTALKDKGLSSLTRLAECFLLVVHVDFKQLHTFNKYDGLKWMEKSSSNFPPELIVYSSGCISEGLHAVSRCMLGDLGNWVHYRVGDFIVEKPDALTRIRFSLTQIDCTHTKGGLCVDSVLICPSNVGKDLCYVDNEARKKVLGCRTT
ncbi:hypothetical protein ACS0TY_024700 [Phlomoides rotata]